MIIILFANEEVFGLLSAIVKRRSKLRPYPYPGMGMDAFLHSGHLQPGVVTRARPCWARKSNMMLLSSTCNVAPGSASYINLWYHLQSAVGLYSVLYNRGQMLKT